MIRYAVAFALFIGAGAFAAPVVSPVWNTDFPDPSVIRAPNGSYYAYGTQGFAPNGRLHNIQVGVSPDLIHWSRKKRCASDEAALGLPHAKFLGARRAFCKRPLLSLFRG